MSAPKLIDQVRSVIRGKHYGRRTENTYVEWIKRYIFFHGKRHPNEMGEAEINAFLTDLAVNKHVSASTQNQALSALLCLDALIGGGLRHSDDSGAIRAQRLEHDDDLYSRAEQRRPRCAEPGGLTVKLYSSLAASLIWAERSAWLTQSAPAAGLIRNYAGFKAMLDLESSKAFRDIQPERLG